MLTTAAYIKMPALTVAVNPFGIVPVFVAMTAQQSVIDRKRIARIAGLAVAGVLITSAVLGESILDLFGISIASFRVGGAILVMLTAISMMQARPSREKQTPEEAEEAEDKTSIAVVPLAVHLLAGPGSGATLAATLSTWPRASWDGCSRRWQWRFTGSAHELWTNPRIKWRYLN